MEKLITLFTFLSLTITAYCQQTHELFVWKGGVPTRIDAVDSITFAAPVTDEHEAIDMGLSVKWAAENLGAATPEAFGLHYAWAEAAPKEDYSWQTYAWGTSEELTKYTTESGLTQIEAADDAATALWGGAWRMPTDAEMKELLDNCTWAWTTQNGTDGYLVTARNGNSIFLPTTGLYYGDFLDDDETGGYYWTSTLRTGYDSFARRLQFDSENCDLGTSSRFIGFAIRAVRP